MPFVHGKQTRVITGPQDASRYLSSAEVSKTIDTAETSTFGSSAKTYIGGMNEATISWEGNYDGSIGALDELLNSLIESDARFPVTLVYNGFPTIVTGRTARLGSVRQTSYSNSSPLDDVVKASGEFQCDGGISFGYILNGEASISSTTVTGTGVDWGASTATARGGRTHIHVLSNTRSADVDVKVQTSTDNSVWVDVHTQTVPATTTAGYSVETTTGAVARYTRALITPAAGTGSAVIIVAFGRN